MTKHRDGKDTISGTHVREGIVIRPITERYHPMHGRTISKLVSPDYHTRKAYCKTDDQWVKKVGVMPRSIYE